MKPPKELHFYLNKHCVKCGLKLVIRNKRIYGHGSETGEPEYLYQIACPKYNWWKTDVLAVLNSRDGWPWHEEHRYLVSEPKRRWGIKGDKRESVVLEQN